MQESSVEVALGAQTLRLSTGKYAKQAHGAVMVQLGDTVVLVAVTEGRAAPEPDFFPLTVDYRERTYAAGKFPGGFIKREGRPSNREILTARLIDRPIRPLFPEDYFNEVQVMITVLSADEQNDPDIVSMIGASAALHVSNCPFLHPTGSVRVGRVDGELVLNPTYEQLESSDLDLIISGTKTAITMIEGFAREMDEDDMVEAILFGHSHIVTIVDTIDTLRKDAGMPDKDIPEAEANPVFSEILEKYFDDFKTAKLTEGKLERAAKVEEVVKTIRENYQPAEGEEPKYSGHQVEHAIHDLEARVVRDSILEGKRIDGRTPTDIRPIWCEVDMLPRPHGSAVFQRGETQALVITTLGTVGDEQRVETLVDEVNKKFMLDYNFPSYSVGECRPIRGPGRREIGHGALAERSLKAVIPDPSEFPYTIRVVSEILESNGSSSMASICGGTLSMMDAGVPLKQPVAGISIGLVKEPDRFILLTDIMGDEDHFGDMDFKVAGTARGITGIQLDLKIDGIEEEIIRETLNQAREARREILKQMLGTLRQPRSEPPGDAPRLVKIKINPEKIGLLIGPGGKTIKAIQEATGAKLDIDDDGTVTIACADGEGAEMARAKVEAMTEEVRVGRIYEGTVKTIKDFGAFIEIAPGREGLCHISELDVAYVNRADEVVKLGETVRVKVIAVDEHDRVKLSRRALMEDEGGEGSDDSEETGERSSGGSQSGSGGGGGGGGSRRERGRDREGGGGGRGRGRSSDSRRSNNND